MRELKPCPFCGQVPKSYSITMTDGRVSEMELECCMKFIISPNVMYHTVGFEEHTFYPSGDAIDRLDIPEDMCVFEILSHIELEIGTLPSAQPEQRYTEEELRVFQNGISLRLLSKRSSQHWQYDEDTATEIKFLERLYEKVGADIRGEQDDS